MIFLLKREGDVLLELSSIFFGFMAAEDAQRVRLHYRATLKLLSGIVAWPRIREWVLEVLEGQPEAQSARGEEASQLAGPVASRPSTRCSRSRRPPRFGPATVQRGSDVTLATEKPRSSRRHHGKRRRKTLRACASAASPGANQPRVRAGDHGGEPGHAREPARAPLF